MYGRPQLRRGPCCKQDVQIGKSDFFKRRRQLQRLAHVFFMAKARSCHVRHDSRRAPWCLLSATGSPGGGTVVLSCPVRLQDIPIALLVNSPCPEDLQPLQGDVAEQSPNPSPGRVMRTDENCSCMSNDDIRCGFDANSIANHARGKQSAMGAFTQDAFFPFHHWTRDLFGPHWS